MAQSWAVRPASMQPMRSRSGRNSRSPSARKISCESKDVHRVLSASTRIILYGRDVRLRNRGKRKAWPGCASTRTCTSTRNIRAPPAGTSTSSISPPGPAARASASSPPATSPIRPGAPSSSRSLVPAEPGLYRLRDDIEQAVGDAAGVVPHAGAVHARGRNLDHLQEGRPHPQSPSDLRARLRYRRSHVGAARADRQHRLRRPPYPRPRFRDLLEIVLEAGPHAYLVPAHIWTPWFAALGSQSGFDSINDCYGDLADRIFAVETGLSPIRR